VRETARKCKTLMPWKMYRLKPNLFATLIALFGGMALWALITFVLHVKLVGVAPMG
jgi:hypothetical protein